MSLHSSSLLPAEGRHRVGESVSFAHSEVKGVRAVLCDVLVSYEKTRQKEQLTVQPLRRSASSLPFPEPAEQPPGRSLLHISNLVTPFEIIGPTLH